MADILQGKEGGGDQGGHPNILAFCYDFDKTLSPEDMQAQGYIQRLGEDVNAFWKKSNELARKNGMDPNLAYMFMMLDGARDKFYVNRSELREFGSKVRLYKGVEEWFDKVNAEGARQGLQVEHYIISSGIKDMIEGTSIGGRFKAIYANTFFYNQGGTAIWPAMVINFTNKTQFLFRIEKGALDVNDPNVNTYYKSSDMRIPFSNMIYIGDSATDIPCMKLVNSFGGHSIGVFDPARNDRTQVYRLIRDRRIRYFAPADYSEGSELFSITRDIIAYIGAGTKLRRLTEKFAEESEKALASDQAPVGEHANYRDPDEEKAAAPGKPQP